MAHFEILDTESIFKYWKSNVGFYDEIASIFFIGNAFKEIKLRAVLEACL